MQTSFAGRRTIWGWQGWQHRPTLPEAEWKQILYPVLNCTHFTSITISGLIPFLFFESSLWSLFTRLSNPEVGFLHQSLFILTSCKFWSQAHLGAKTHTKNQVCALPVWLSMRVSLKSNWNSLKDGLHFTTELGFPPKYVLDRRRMSCTASG